MRLIEVIHDALNDEDRYQDDDERCHEHLRRLADNLSSMCRLFGYVAFEEKSPREMVGADLDGFIELSGIHKDGWGISRIENNHATVTKAAEEARSSGDFRLALEGRSSGSLIHIRWATPGLGIDDSNAHPFIYGEYSFIHNGSIQPYDALASHIDPELLKLRQGSTDSELLFLFILTHINRLGVVEGVISAIKEIKSSFTYSSINSMFLSKDYLIVISENNPSNRPAWADDEYYKLRYRKDENGIVVASSGWNQDSWIDIPQSSVLICDRKTLAISSHAL